MTVYKYTFEREAVIELNQIALNYKKESDEKAFKFEECFFNTVDHIRESPELYHIYVKPDVRRLKIYDHPYYILYRTLKKIKTIEILAIGYERKRESYWLERSN